MAAAQGLPDPASAQGARWDVSQVSVEVRVDRAVAAHVHQRFTLAGPLDSVAFMQLRFSCASLGGLELLVGDVRVPLSSTVMRPWQRWRTAAGSPVPAGAAIDVRYRVSLPPGATAIPLLVPAGRLFRGQTTGASDPLVTLAVMTGQLAGAPVLPRFNRQGDGTWTTRLPAMPSFIRLDRGMPAAGTNCADRLEGGTAQRLELVFLLFVVTLVLWVPLYFVWVRYSAGARSRAWPE
jgi:hypothetical protein